MTSIHADYLIELVTIARKGSLSAAALELSTSQSALSRHIKALESSLGLKLLDRLQGGVELTSAGHYICNRSGDIVDAVEDIEFYASQQHSDGIITFGGMTIFPGVIKKIADLWENEHTGFRPKASPPSSFGDYGIQELIGRKKIDVYLTLGSDDRLDYLDEGYEIIQLAQTPVMAAMEPTHHLSTKEVLTLQDFAGELLLHAQSEFDGERINWADTKALLRSVGVDFRSKTCTLESESDLVTSLRSGIILLPLAYSGVSTFINSGKTVKAVDNAQKCIVAVCEKDTPQASLLRLVEQDSER